ncbi:class I SAM-dependent methyltransferase [Haladaptatus halobius]|uniref:class I SAM-dependent methyltransferase n=1 Tax=Haladaptatus halobius TaxID=2884875 RepID=UPI001D0A0914|nr:class I SAM-dependent methyltransferase [Haladaptatus halobius]
MTFQQYLAAKRTVDDRALNRRVLARFRRELPDSVRLLEVGAGTGAMVERLHLWGCLPREVHYTVLDIDPENLEIARERLLARGFDSRGDELRLERGDRRSTIVFEVADAVEFARATDRKWDAIVGHAVADLLDLDSAIPALLSALEPDGICYFPITFDGGTTFDPVHPLDGRVERLYHRHMDDEGGCNRAGRRLLAGLRARDATVLAAGSSDWLVYPRAGSYPADEQVFLRHIIGIIESALADHPALETEAFAEWSATRRRQVEKAELTYVAHQLDVLARRA